MKRMRKFVLVHRLKSWGEHGTWGWRRCSESKATSKPQLPIAPSECGVCGDSRRCYERSVSSFYITISVPISTRSDRRRWHTIESSSASLSTQHHTWVFDVCDSCACAFLWSLYTWLISRHFLWETLLGSLVDIWIIEVVLEVLSLTKVWKTLHDEFETTGICITFAENAFRMYLQRGTTCYYCVVSSLREEVD